MKQSYGGKPLLSVFQLEETEFPKKQVQVQHPTDGLKSVIMNDESYGGCIKCLDCHNVGFGWVSFWKLCQLLDSDAEIRANFEEALAYLSGETSADWPLQKAAHRRQYYSDEWVDWGGFTKKQFEIRFRNTPDAMGVPGVMKIHPLSKQVVEIFYGPLGQSLFTLRLGSREAHMLNTDMMPRQLYKLQGEATVDRLGYEMKPHLEYKDILLSSEEFDNLSAQARVVGAGQQYGPPRAAGSTSSARNVWQSPGAASGQVTPVAMQTPVGWRPGVGLWRPGVGVGMCDRGAGFSGRSDAKPAALYTRRNHALSGVKFARS